MKLNKILAGSLLAALLSIPQLALADPATLNNSPNIFSSSDDQSNLTNYSLPAHPLTIPDSTPTPVEGYRWPRKKIYIYMVTSDPKIKTAFQDAVKQWNALKIVHLVWTSRQSKAGIIAQAGDLSTASSSNTLNYQTRQNELGETETSYNDQYHVIIHAVSTLDPQQVDFSSRLFRSRVAAHELGHALGLAHAPEYEHSIMIPRNPRSGITKNDRKSLAMLYH